MRNILLIAIFAITQGWIANAEDRPVKKGLEALKTNKENAKVNYEQYKLNYEITSENKKETEKAIKDLKSKKKTLIKNANNIEQNKKKMDGMKQEIVQFKVKEESTLNAANLEIDKLKDLLEKLQKNADQHKANIMAYDKKLAEIDQEKKNWDTQKQQLDEIKTTIDRKVAGIEQDRKKWTDKNVDYGKEMKKWKKEYSLARKTHKKYDKLNDDND